MIVESSVKWVGRNAVGAENNSFNYTPNLKRYIQRWMYSSFLGKKYWL